MPPLLPSGLIRLSFRLGPWTSPTAKGWQAAYDGLVALLVNAGAPVYGLLEADLAPGEPGSARWFSQYAQHAAQVVARYADRVHTFEVLPGPNQIDTNGRSRLSPAAFARGLALVYEAVKAEGRGRETVLVAGAIALAADGAGYLSQTLTFGVGSTAWEGVRQATRSAAPFDAVACWPSLPDRPDPLDLNAVAEPVERFLQALAGNTAVKDKPVYLSGFTLAGAQGAECTTERLDRLTAHLLERRPGLRLALRDAASAGPASSHELSPSVVGAYALLPVALPVPLAMGARPFVPSVDGFDYPVGPRDQREPPQGYNSAAGLAGDEYFRLFGVWHTGEDWNGPGAGDADLGLPVYAIAAGLVTMSDFFTPSWGNIVLMEHTLPSGTKVWSQYAHLRERLVKAGDVVERGQQVGTIGKGANDAWLAHLHFEIRQADLPANTWLPFVRDRQWVLDHYFDTIVFTRKHRPGLFVTEGVVVDSEPGEQENGSFTRSATAHWFPSYFGWHGTSLYTFASRSETEWGEWRPRLPQTGRYDVQVWIPSFHATTRAARYVVTHQDGAASVAVDQSRFNDEWVSLGVFPFGTQGAVVRLTDQTGEADEARLEVCFDAVRWLPVAS
ncbi:MAG: peptidoglycan DD-metalloendopeptidase family protein [Anaerolineae bacterium]|nr:peptidoglycan DD-metalloendopeptidase family protein [Anaerolineae bacterium]